MTTRPADDTLPRDPRFDAAWRTTSSEEPPHALGAAIRAAAHREVGAKPQSLAAHAAMRARRRWWPLAAAATVAVIAIGVVQRAGHDELVVPAGDTSIVTDMPAQTPKSVAEAPQRPPEPPQSGYGRAKSAPGAGGGATEGRARADSGAKSQAALEAQPAARADASRHSETIAAPSSEKKAQSVANTAPSLPEPFPANSPKPSAAESRDAAPATPAEIGAAQRQEVGSSAKQAAPPPPMPMPPAASFADSTRVSAPSAMRSSPVAKTAGAGAAEEARIKDRAPLPVNDWIALIRRLRDEGNTVEAARELAAFRAAHVDHEKLLPPDLRDWHPADK